MHIEIRPVMEASELKIFNEFPQKIYNGYFHAPGFPQCTPNSLRPMDPLYGRVTAQPFLAMRGGTPAGRIVASIHKAYPVKDTGFFGYFESINDISVADAMIQAVRKWLFVKGKGRAIGPVDLTPHVRLGLLTDGFAKQHLPGMPYNPPYYGELLINSGLTKEINLYAYHYLINKRLPKKLVRVAGRARRRVSELSIRGVNLNEAEREGKALAEIHNGSMEDGWGFVPLSDEEGTAVWLRLRGHCDPRMILLAELAGRPIGICLAINPSYRSRRCLRLAVLAVLPQYRLRGIEAVLIQECLRRAMQKGIHLLEFSQVAENNAMMNHIIKTLGNINNDRNYGIYQSNAINF